MATLTGCDETINVTSTDALETDGSTLAFTTDPIIFTPGTDANWQTSGNVAVKIRMVDVKYTREYISSTEGHTDSGVDPTIQTVFTRSNGDATETTTITARDETVADTTISATGSKGLQADQKIHFVITGMEDGTKLVITYQIEEDGNLTTDRSVTITAANIAQSVLMTTARHRELNRKMAGGNTLTATAATAKIIFDATVTADKEIVLIDTAGTSKTYTAKTSEDTAAREFNNSTSAAANATSFAACVNASDGHGATITAVVDAPQAGGTNNMVVLTQDVAGSAGNTTITPTAGTEITEFDFSGGSEGGQYLDFNTFKARLKKKKK
tara:strand:+ start:710 stop:1690 length:981 start_codon:yes stop_codon:yes gene_type:complete